MLVHRDAPRRGRQPPDGARGPAVVSSPARAVRLVAAGRLGAGCGPRARPGAPGREAGERADLRLTAGASTPTSPTSESRSARPRTAAYGDGGVGRHARLRRARAAPRRASGRSRRRLLARLACSTSCSPGRCRSSETTTSRSSGRTSRTLRPRPLHAARRDPAGARQRGRPLHGEGSGRPLRHRRADGAGRALPPCPVSTTQARALAWQPAGAARGWPVGDGTRARETAVSGVAAGRRAASSS